MRIPSQSAGLRRTASATFFIDGIFPAAQAAFRRPPASFDPSLCPWGWIYCLTVDGYKCVRLTRAPHVCRFPSQTPEGEDCPSGQVYCAPQEKCLPWDELCSPDDTGEEQCPPGWTYCAPQNQCIPADKPCEDQFGMPGEIAY